jgi:hypothetical protein
MYVLSSLMCRGHVKDLNAGCVGWPLGPGCTQMLDIGAGVAVYRSGCVPAQLRQTPGCRYQVVLGVAVVWLVCMLRCQVHCRIARCCMRTVCIESAGCFQGLSSCYICTCVHAAVRQSAARSIQQLSFCDCWQLVLLRCSDHILACM